MAAATRVQTSPAVTPAVTAPSRFRHSGSLSLALHSYGDRCLMIAITRYISWRVRWHAQARMAHDPQRRTAAHVHAHTPGGPELSPPPQGPLFPHVHAHPYTPASPRRTKTMQGSDPASAPSPSRSCPDGRSRSSRPIQHFIFKLSRRMFGGAYGQVTRVRHCPQGRGLLFFCSSRTSSLVPLWLTLYSP